MGSGAASDGAAFYRSFALVSTCHEVDREASSTMQTVFLCAHGTSTTFARVPASTTLRTVLVQHARVPANHLQLLMLRIRNKSVSIDDLLAHHVDATEGDISMDITLRHRSGVRDNPNTGNFSYFFRASRSNLQGNAPTAEGGSNFGFQYFFPASRFRPLGNGPAAEGRPENIGESGQQTVPSTEQILSLLGLSPVVKEVKDVQPAQTKRTKEKNTSSGTKTSKGIRKTRTYRRKEAQKPEKAKLVVYEWDPILAFKDNIHLLSPGFEPPITSIEFRNRVGSDILSLSQTCSVGLNDPRNVFSRYTTTDGRLTFRTNKLFTSDLNTPTEPAAEEEPANTPREPSNGEFCVDMKFRYINNMETGHARHDVHNIVDAG